MKILIVGSGQMAGEYLKVLHYLKKECVIVGRGEKNIEKLKKEFPNYQYHSGGLDKYLKLYHENEFEFSINTVNVKYLFATTQLLIKAKIQNILVEKPGSLELSELVKLNKNSRKHDLNIYVAYNRRFFDSIIKLKELLTDDGGAKNLKFDFTEWTHTIEPKKFDEKTLKYWIISNSSHVIDTVFHIIGLPEKINCENHSQSKIKWHPSSSVFVGSGISEKNIPFSYNSNWTSAGRWMIEVCTDKGKYILSPMEKIKYIRKGEITENIVPVRSVDQNLKFKEGFLNQLKSFFSNKENLCDLNEHIKHFKYYKKIGNY